MRHEVYNHGCAQYDATIIASGVGLGMSSFSVRWPQPIMLFILYSEYYCLWRVLERTQHTGWTLYGVNQVRLYDLWCEYSCYGLKHEFHLEDFKHDENGI